MPRIKSYLIVYLKRQMFVSLKVVAAFVSAVIAVAGMDYLNVAALG